MVSVAIAKHQIYRMWTDWMAIVHSAKFLELAAKTRMAVTKWVWYRPLYMDVDADF